MRTHKVVDQTDVRRLSPARGESRTSHRQQLAAARSPILGGTEAISRVKLMTSAHQARPLSMPLVPKLGWDVRYG